MASDPAPPATIVKRLMRGAWRATLATTLAGQPSSAWPYASLVLTACDTDISPLLFLSNLAAHTANLMRAPEASILFDGTQGLDEPLAGPRATVLGRIEPVEDTRALDRYLRRHPSAGAYRGFGDFRLWRMTPERAHLVGGFGQIRWVEAEAFASTSATAIAQAEPALLDVLNGAGALVEALGGRLQGGSQWRLTGLDPDGVDLRRADGMATRAEFPAAIDDPAAIMPALEALVA
ncbi:MAG TPA: pyridoxamine 5'-phosphate oxidase family protein [Caulobacteraceae bacterium]|nr:pyridoxamine 5'-phosphate oxidase family protein [Caulobacteraceae bacterium]